MDFKFQKLQSGVTLIEVVMYLAFFSLFFITLIQFYFFLNNQTNQAQIDLIIDRNQIFLDQHFDDTFSSSETINLTESDLAGSPATIVLITQTGTNQTYEFNGNQLDFINESGELSNMLSRSIFITNTNLEYINSPQGETIGVNISFDLNYNERVRNLSQNYFTQDGI